MFLVRIAALAIIALVIFTANAFAQAPTPEQRFKLPAGSVEITHLRNADSQTFIRPDGMKQAIFELGMNYEAQPGVWVESRPTFDNTNKSAVAATIIGTDLILGDALGRFIIWELPKAPTVFQDVAGYSDRGIQWTYRRHNTGVKLEGIVTSPQGIQTYTFPYRAATPLISGSDGAALGLGFTVPRATVIAANGRRYDFPWTVKPGSLELTFNDAGIATPYVIDPTTNFNPPASTDDGYTISSVGAYPPSCTTSTTAGSTAITSKEDVAGSASVNGALVRFDTSSIQDGALVTSATLNLHLTGIVDADARNYEAEWYAASNWPIDCGDYAVTVSGNAFTQDITTLTNDAVNGFTLSTPTNVNLTGYTGFRMAISGGDPGGNNRVDFRTVETTPAPQLSVTYTEMVVTSVDNTPVAANGTKSFTATGDVLTGVTAVRLEKSGEPNINCSGVSVSDDEHVDFDCNLTGAADGAWDVVATKPAGSATGSGILDVHALAVSAVDPTSGLNTGSVSVTVTGDGFDTGVQLTLTKSGESDIACTSETITTTLVELTADCDLTGVATGFWSVVATNTDTTAATLTNGFLVSTVVTLQAVGVTSGEHTLRLLNDGATVTFYLDDVEQDAYASPLTVVDNGNDWEALTNGAMPAMEEITLSMTGSQALNWQLRDLPGFELTDFSGNGHDVLMYFPETTDDFSDTLQTAAVAAATGEQSPLPDVGQAVAPLDNFATIPAADGNSFWLFQIFQDEATETGFPYEAIMGMFVLAFVVMIMVVAARAGLTHTLFIGGCAIATMVILWLMGAAPAWYWYLFALIPFPFFLLWKHFKAA